MDDLAVPLTGWSDVAAGYSVRFAVGDVPWWLRVWFSAPFIAASPIHDPWRGGTAVFVLIQEWLRTSSVLLDPVGG